jgi:hypothetical protein
MGACLATGNTEEKEAWRNRGKQISELVIIFCLYSQCAFALFTLVHENEPPSSYKSQNFQNGFSSTPYVSCSASALTRRPLLRRLILLEYFS